MMTPEVLRVMDNLPVPMSFAETASEPPRVLFINKMFKQVFGYALEEISTVDSWAKLAYPEEAYRHEVMNAWVRDAEQAFNNGTTIPIREVEIQARDGTKVRTLLHGSFIGSAIVVTFIDISQQVRAEAELRDVRQMLERTAYELTENLPVGTYTMVLPPNGGLGQFRFLSSRFLEITGLTREAMQADPLLAFTCIHPDDYDRWLELNRHAFETKTPFYGEARLCTKPNECWIAAESKPRSLPDGSMIWEGVIIDITARKLAEAALTNAKARAEALERIKSDFLTRMSHEIRTPLSMMLGLTDLLTDEHDQVAMAEKIGQLKNAGNLLLGIVNDILDLSKIEAGQLITDELPFELSALYASVRAFAASITKPDLQLVLKHPRGQQPTLIGDQRRIEQILGNLIGNAIKFTHSGEITVTFHLHNQQSTTARLRVSVKDTGKGIDPSQIPELFTPFTQGSSGITREYGGTGLGLSISKELVELMGGLIDVHSEPGKGSTFWFELPLAILSDEVEDVENAEATTPEQIPNLALEPLKGINLLVVDDSLSIRRLIREFLRRAGATVEVAENGSQALEILKTCGQKFDCVMMDVHMPAMDGLTATKLIREIPQLDKLPVLAMTAGLLAEQQARARQSGMADVVAKPVKPTRMVQQILKSIGRSATASTTSVDNNTIPAIQGIDQRRVTMTMEGSLEMFDLLTDVFVQEFSDFEPKIKAMLADTSARTPNLENARRLAHSLHGSAKQLAATDLSQAAAELEIALTGDHSSIEPKLKRVSTVLDDLIQALERHHRSS